MEYNFVTNIESCYTEIPRLLYYSHIPPAIIVLLFGIFVLFKSKDNRLAGKILFLISIFSFAWVSVEGAIWLQYSSINMMLLWSFLGTLYAIIHILSLYFVYVIIDKQDVSLNKKYIFAILLLPIILLTPTAYNLTGFDITNCQSVEGSYFIGYRYFIGIVSIIWILALLYLRYKKAQQESKKQILFLGFGILSFLSLFSWSEISGSLTQSFEVTQYGLFGMPIFVAFLTYLIVRYKAFDIKLLGAQALVVSLIILVGSQFFFVQNPTSRILTGITLILAVGFGWALIKSVKNEVKRKEELQIMSDRLAMANDQLRKLDNAKSEFISIASHQLRTPLTAIKGFVSLLLEGTYGEINAGEREALNKVYISCERLIQLVENLLNVSRIESGRIEYEFRKWRPEDIIKEISDSLVFAARNKGLYLHLDLPREALPEIEVDGAKIKEVVSNLVDNAVKYTRRGGVTVRAEILNPKSEILNKSQIQNSKFQTADYDADVIRITVSDTGIGVPESDLPYLFSKFSRGRDTNRLHVTGTGLGLYVGKSIVDAHHGKIWVESEGEGRGSRFIVELPLSQEKFRRQERVEEFVKEI